MNFIDSSHLYVEYKSGYMAEPCIRCLIANFDIDSILVTHRSTTAAIMRIKTLDTIIYMQQYCSSNKSCVKMHLIEDYSQYTGLEEAERLNAVQDFVQSVTNKRLGNLYNRRYESGITAGMYLPDVDYQFHDLTVSETLRHAYCIDSKRSRRSNSCNACLSHIGKTQKFATFIRKRLSYIFYLISDESF